MLDDGCVVRRGQHVVFEGLAPTLVNFSCQSLSVGSGERAGKFPNLTAAHARR